MSTEYCSVTSFLQPVFHHFCSHVCHTHFPFFCLFSFIASLIFDPFSSLGHWSLSLWPSSFVAFLHSCLALLNLSYPFCSSAVGLPKSVRKLLSLPLLLCICLWSLCCAFLSLSLSLPALQITQLGCLPSYMLARQVDFMEKKKTRTSVSMWVSLAVFVLIGLLSCDGVPASLCILFFSWICIWECVWDREGESTEKWSFDFTAFLSCRYLLPSSNLFVYQAKMLSERLLRELDNPYNTQTLSSTKHAQMHISLYLPASLFSASFSAAKPSNVQKRTQTRCHQPHTLTYAPSLRCLLSAALCLGCVAGSHWGLTCETEGLKKGYITAYYQQTSTLLSLVIQKLLTRSANVFSHIFSCQFGFAPQFTKRGNCQNFQSWPLVKKEISTVFHMMLTFDKFKEDCR